MIYRYYGSGAGTAIASVSIDGRMDDKINDVYLDVGMITPTDGEQIYCELSWVSQIQRGVNDANSILASSIVNIELTTSGLAIANVFKHFNYAAPVAWEGGERLYLHMWTTSTTVQTVYATVITAGSVNKPSNKRR